MNASRLRIFEEKLSELASRDSISLVQPVRASEDELLLFHTKQYVDRVKKLSETGEGYLDYGDTPAFKGVYEASMYPVGNTLNGLESLMEGKFDHFFNPVGGLHHASSDEARGFCVFNDSSIAISRAINEYRMRSVAYVDIDAHHGDGIYYEFEADPRVIVGDIHEDGHYLFPGTGMENETGKGFGLGTKMNIGLKPGSGDEEFFKAFDGVEDFIAAAKPDFIFFQCGADGLAGDPLTHLRYSSRPHAYAAGKLHALSHKICKGRILAMGGGGYNPQNVSAAWSAVIEELSRQTE